MNTQKGKGRRKTAQEKEFLYVGHYTDTEGHYILKIGTTNDLKRRAQEHTRNYHRTRSYTLPKEDSFIYDWTHKLSKYNTLRYEDKNRERWKEEKVGELVRNDRFCCKEKPCKVTIKIRKTYEIKL